jgi:hypothetical protein
MYTNTGKMGNFLKQKSNVHGPVGKIVFFYFFPSSLKFSEILPFLH